MAYEAVKAYFDSLGMGDRVTYHDTVCDTVEHAAEQIGCLPAQIAKTMSFLVDDDRPIVIVCTGDAKISNAKYKAFFHKKAKMIPWDSVEEITGHIPGGVCPFALKAGVTVYLDETLKRFADVHAAAGAPAATVHLTVDELDRVSGRAAWIDVCEIREQV